VCVCVCVCVSPVNDHVETDVCFPLPLHHVPLHPQTPTGLHVHPINYAQKHFAGFTVNVQHVI